MSSYHDEEDDTQMLVSSSSSPRHRDPAHKRKLGLVAAIFAAILLAVVLATVFKDDGSSDKKDPRTAEKDPVKLLRHFVDVDSTSGSELAMADLLEAWLQEQGWKTERQIVEETPKLRVNILAYIGARSSIANVRVLVNSHIDTVPPFFPSSENSTHILGRGTVDAKGSVVAQILTATSLKDEGVLSEGLVALVYVVGEEVNGLGMKAVNSLGIKPTSLLVGEPTELKMAAGHKGGMAFTMASYGKAAHSGYPELGESAILNLIQVITDLNNHVWDYDEYFGNTTLNFGLISGGVASNVVPAYASGVGLFRLSVPPQSVKDTLYQIVDARVDINITSENAPFRCEVLPGFDSQVVSYGTDLWYFYGDHSSYLYGPGSILVAHTENEAISKSDLSAAIEGNREILLQLLGKK